MPQRKKKISTLLDVKTLQNEIVRFEPFEKSHYDLIIGTSVIEEVWKWMPAVAKRSGIVSYLDYLREQGDAGKMATFVVFRKSDNAFAGVAGYMQIDPFHRQIQIGFAWHPEAMWREIFPSAHMLLIERAHDWQAKRLSWHVSPNNAAAMNAMGFLQATQEARLRSFIRTGDGRWSDIIIFSMLRDEMRQAVTRLKKRISDRLSRQVEQAHAETDNPAHPN